MFVYGQLIFHSREHNIRPLVKFVSLQLKRRRKLIIFDKYIGRAAALLFILLKPAIIYTPVISKSGAQTLRKAHISFKAQKHVPHLMNVASTGMCKWEKLSSDKNPREFYNLVKSV